MSDTFFTNRIKSGLMMIRSKQICLFPSLFPTLFSFPILFEFHCCFWANACLTSEFLNFDFFLELDCFCNKETNFHGCCRSFPHQKWCGDAFPRLNFVEMSLPFFYILCSLISTFQMWRCISTVKETYFHIVWK